jgi:ubiquinone/menaquinone biosynthesis C-methylase UbiE
MVPKIINDEQYKFWNEGIGKKWVKEDESMNERFTFLTKDFFSKININKDERILDIGCGGGITSFEASMLVGENGYVIGADISEILLDLAKKNYSNIKNLEFKYCDVQNYEFEKNRFNKVISRFGVMFFEDPIEAFKNINHSIQDGGSLHFVCWTNVMENEFFTAAADIIIKHLNKGFPEVSRAPGPFAFSEEGYVKEILNASGFKNVKVDKVYSLITTNDSAVKDGNLLLNIGLAGRLLSEENISEEELSVIKDKIIVMCQNRQVNGKINYKACLNFVSATK